MKRGKLIIAVGLITVLLLLLSTACSADTLKSSQNSSREEPPAEEVTTTEDEEITSEDEGSPEEEASTEEDGSSGDDATTEDETEPEPTENPETNCSSLNPHPMAEGITEQFDVTYDQVMTWYCDGAAFSDIMLALETVQLVDTTVEELLSELEDSSWDEIWQDLGIEK